MKLKPSDLDKIFSLEEYEKINVDELVRSVKTRLKKALIEAEILVFDTNIKLSTTRTRFNGEKFWFVCPSCHKKVGVLLKSGISKKVGCRSCFKSTYFKQIYKS